MKPKKNLSEIINTTTYIEDKKTINLFSLSGNIKEQGFLTKEQAIKILKWKSPRPLKHFEKNSNEDFIEITKVALMQTDEKLKIHILTALKGVQIPSASAILMFSDQTAYPIIDIRVWKQLYRMNIVKENPKGQAFLLEQWVTYLKEIRRIAKENKMTARQVEKRLFDYDVFTQEGSLY